MYLNGELLPLELECQVLVVRQVTCQTVQMWYLANMQQACEGQRQPISNKSKNKVFKFYVLLY